MVHCVIVNGTESMAVFTKGPRSTCPARSSDRGADAVGVLQCFCSCECASTNKPQTDPLCRAASSSPVVILELTPNLRDIDGFNGILSGSFVPTLSKQREPVKRKIHLSLSRPVAWGLWWSAFGQKHEWYAYAVFFFQIPKYMYFLKRSLVWLIWFLPAF